MATTQDYQVGTAVCAAYVKANVPSKYSWAIQANAVEAAAHEAALAKAVIDAVDAARAKATT
jgi:hypothetical protein